jgi:hypothetical protein
MTTANASIRTTVTGTFTRSALRDLLRPIAWQGTVDAEYRAAEESAIRALVEEARDCLDSNPDAHAVEIVDGELIGSVVE